MPSKLQMYEQMADQTAKQVTGSFGEWTAFLETMGRLYKYPFHEQLKQKRYEDEVIRCLDGQSRFSEEMLARLIAEAETEVRQAKEEYAELLRNDTTRATIQQIRSYYDEFLGWANEFDLATIPRKRAILGQLIEKVEVGKGYKVTVHLRMSYAQFLGIEGNGEIQVRKDVCA